MDNRDNPSSQYDEDDEFPPPRRGVSPATIAGIIALIVLVIGGIFAVTRLTSGQGSTNALPTPTLIPGTDLFYAQTTPVWGNIVIDGHVLARLPDPAFNPPIQLSAGAHQVVWHVDPFQLQQCTIVVPPIVSETKCLSSDLVPITVGKHKGLSAYLITFSLSLGYLPDAQRSALLSTAQALLDRLSSIETVQPGEHFVNLQANNYVETATSTLHARQGFLLDTDPSSNASCYMAGDNFQLSNCEVNGENCHLFCNNMGQGLSAPARFWAIFAPIQLTWSYTALSGQVVAQNQPDVASATQPDYLVELFITWDGMHWQVAENTQGKATGFLDGDPNCIAALSYVDQSINFSEASLPENPDLSVSWNGNAGSDPGTGCLLVVVPQALNGTPAPHPEIMALCLYRFGVLLAVNKVAHTTWPQLPVADANEQAIAQQIARQTSVI